MSRRSFTRAAANWSKAITRTVRAITKASKVKPAKKKRAVSAKSRTRLKAKASTQTSAKSAVKSKPKTTPRQSAFAAGQSDWLSGVSMGSTGARRHWLYRPPGLKPGVAVPLLVMLHGCTQDAKAFAASTRMNALARREGFLVLYPEQSRLDNPQRCWNWYDTRNGHAQREAARIMAAIDQVRLRHPFDGARVAVLGLSAGASMGALLATLYPERFKAVVMHSGVPCGVANSTATALGAMRGQRLPKPLAPGQGAEPWPPLMVIQGQSDPVVSPRNGKATAEWWAGSTGAGKGVERSVQRGQRYPMTVIDFKLRGRTVVSLVSVASLGHAWSGGAASQPYSDPKGPDATGMAWTFVARQFRQVAPPEPAVRPTRRRP